MLDPVSTPYDEARPLTDHLEEFRKRLLWSLVALAVFAVPGYLATDFFLHQLARMTGPMVFVKPLEAFAVRLRLGVTLGFFFSGPVLLYHAWRFFGVAATVSERRVLLGALPFAYGLFAAGACFGWFVVTPVGLKVLISFGSRDLRPMISAAACLEFATLMSLGLGVLFQVPVVVAGLAKWGMLRAASLRTYRKHALLGILVASAVFTPGPDVVSQLLLAVPTYVLFEVSILLAAWLEPKDA